MFKRRPVKLRAAKDPTRRVRLKLEPLEDRWMLHTGVELITDGITANAAPAGIVSLPNDTHWFAEYDASRIGRVSHIGNSGFVTEFTLPAGRGPLNIIVGPDNRLWFTSNLGDRIGRIDPNAGSDAAIQASITEFVVPGAGSAPNDLTVGPDGALWFTQTGSDQIGRITTAGVITEFAVPGAGSAPSGITAGSDGALWFTQAGSGQIGRVTTAGAFTEFAIPVPDNSVSDPEDIVAGPGGHLYFTDFGRDQIGRITTAGLITQFDLRPGRGPLNLVSFRDGDLYFTMSAASRIGRLPASALAVGAPTSGAPPLEEFDFIPGTSTPVGISVAPNGEIWFTLNAGNAVASFAAHLQQLTATSTGGTVKVFDVLFQQVRSFSPFPGSRGPLSLAVAEVSGNGVPDVIVGAPTGLSPQVKVFDGKDNSLVGSFFAFAPNFRGGITVGSDDVNGDGRADVVVAAGSGMSASIIVVDGLKIGEVMANGQIAPSAVLASFLAFAPSYRRGVSLAVGDVNRDGKSEIIVGSAAGVAPQVLVIDGSKLSQVQSNGQIANSALLGNFFAFAPSFRGGVNVAFNKNVFRRDIIVGVASDAASRVKVIDGTKLGQLQPDRQIAASALVGDFFAFDPKFRGGVRVAADDLTFDGSAEVLVAAGPTTATGTSVGPRVRIVDGTKLRMVLPNGQISPAALRKDLLVDSASFKGGVSIASDADHRDGPVFGPPGITITNSRRDINDMFVFRSPTNPANTVLAMTVSPFSTATTPNSFVEGLVYEFRITNRNVLSVSDDLTFRMTFGPADAAGVQDVGVRALPAARFAGAGGVVAKGLTGQNLPLRGVGGSGAMFRAAEQDDPFFFDAAGFNALLNNPTAVQGVVDGEYPRGTSPNGFGPGSTPNLDAPNFFADANTLALVMEIPSTRVTAAGSNAIGFWGRTEFAGVQVDRMGRPAINTAVMPPIPRGAGFPIGGTADQNRQDRRNAFNAGHPSDDRADFRADVVSVLTTFYPAGRPGGVPNAAQAGILADFLLPDILVHDVTSTAGFGGQVVVSGGNAFLGGGRKLSDDIISTEVAVLTDDDLPAAFGGGPNLPAIVTQNVMDDNGLSLRDGSINPATGAQRTAVFPYFGSRKPAGVPGGNPPP